jgi:hypothetical protein
VLNNSSVLTSEKMTKDTYFAKHCKICERKGYWKIHTIQVIHMISTCWSLQFEGIITAFKSTWKGQYYVLENHCSNPNNSDPRGLAEQLDVFSLFKESLPPETGISLSETWDTLFDTQKNIQIIQTVIRPPVMRKTLTPVLGFSCRKYIKCQRICWKD